MANGNASDPIFDLGVPEDSRQRAIEALDGERLQRAGIDPEHIVDAVLDAISVPEDKELEIIEIPIGPDGSVRIQPGMIEVGNHLRWVDGKCFLSRARRD